MENLKDDDYGVAKVELIRMQDATHWWMMRRETVLREDGTTREQEMIEIPRMALSIENHGQYLLELHRNRIASLVAGNGSYKNGSTHALLSAE